MRGGIQVAAIIPALNEERSIEKVLAAIPAWVDDVIVVDNGSTDATAARARALGARVVSEPLRGYGAACLRGVSALRDSGVVVFLDADFSDYPEEMDRLVDGIVAGKVDFALGSRVAEDNPQDALTPQQRVGNFAACALIRLFWRVRYSDLGPFRAIGRQALERLDMRDRGFGWTVEMQIKAAQQGLRVREVPTRYRPRIGCSKISGTVKGSVMAGSKIIYVILSAALRQSLRRTKDSDRRRGTA